MRRGIGFLWVTLTGILLAIVGVVAYQAGWSEGAATHVADGVAAAVPYYYYGPHFFGFGIFGFLFFLFLLFVIFRIARFGFLWGPRAGGAGGFGAGWKGGYGHRYGGGSIPPAIDERMQEWHRRAHGEPTPAPPSDTKTV
jgi:hypothetical protein